MAIRLLFLGNGIWDTAGITILLILINVRYSEVKAFYHDPVMYDMGKEVTVPGYATEIVKDLSIDWMKSRDREKPFMLMCHHKAPHRPWDPDEKHAHMYEEMDIP
ncbi:hypothetical protein ACFVAD_19310 [Sutcliffiella sp. NPDC057660]|uniref:hypothetical protein n=1 Tax=Sutcliffiella sp. NPDC057660 TaxID=3346199 RepID=UPI003680CC67